MMNPQDVEYRLNTDLFFFAEEAPLMIKPKSAAEGGAVGAGEALIPWKPNIAQHYIHEQLEAQRKKTGGIVRAVLLKGRQQGGSTYTEMRFYHRARSVPGTSVFVLSHDGEASSKIFAMVERAHNNVHPEFQPEVGKANVRQLTFPKLLSDYRVATAGNEDAGRAGTAQLFHWSEVAFCPNAEAIKEASLEAIAYAPGTEVILESTSNGPAGLFYSMAMAAIKGIGDYIFIFTPWFWQNEYERADDGTPLTEAEEAYIELYFKQPFPTERERPVLRRIRRKMLWRRAKILEYSIRNGGIDAEAGEAKFQAVYPSNPIEAFQFTGIGLFTPKAIVAARKSTAEDPDAALIAGVDGAGDSERSDRTVITLRRGRVIEDVIVYDKMRPMRLAGIIAQDLIMTRGVDMVFIDRGYGEGTIDRLHELGFRRKVLGVAFNEGPLQPDIYLNKRSEIIIEFAKWLNQGGVRIPDRNDIHADLACIPLDEETSNGLKFLPSKREIRKKFGRSTDIVDSAALTFAYPVNSRLFDSVGGAFFKKKDEDGARTSYSGTSATRSGPLGSLNRKRAGRGVQ
ncbi:MAG: hypothetical protein KGJ13_02385 [Patescibacteria group bacterium]|nr:hypothetical protein [Patescibacteria group bacterium]